MMKNSNMSSELTLAMSSKAHMNHYPSKFTIKPSVVAAHSVLQTFACGFVLSGCFIVAPAWGQGNTSMSGANPGQAQFDVGGKTVPVNAMNLPVQAGVAYKRMDGIALSAANSNLPVTADEGFWRESLGLPIGSKILLSVSAGQAPADGNTQLKIKIEVFDAQGKRYLKPTKLLLETSLGTFEGLTSAFSAADGSAVPKRSELNQLQVAIDGGLVELVLKAPAVPGDALLRVSSGAVAVQGEIAFLPDLRDMLVVGIVEGAINLSKAKGPRAGDIREFGFSDNLRNWEKSTTTIGNESTEYKTVAGRVALFAKGAIKGEYLLTAAVDTDKITSQKLFRDIDPNAFYPIYGDTSVKRFDAQSASRVYVRVDKDRSYVLYGDYTTASTDQANKLASLGRTLTGGQAQYENEGVKITAFAAKTANKGYVDEQPGRGISGPYALGRPNAIANSETVELLVRDRNQPALVLSRKTLARFVDYDFEPFSGRVLFRQAVPSVDENNNPVSIRIAYEVEEEAADKHWIGGISAKVNVGQNVALGASYAKDQDAQAPYEIAGVNIEVKLGDRTYLVAELASSKGTNAYNQSFSAITEANPLVKQSGKAARVEIRHEEQNARIRAYANQSDAGFQNATAGVLPGRREAGVVASYQINPALEVKLDVLKTEDRSGTATDGANRSAAGLTLAAKVTDAIQVEVGVNSVKEHLVNGSGGALNTVSAQSSSNSSVPGWGFNGTGLLASPSQALSEQKNAPPIADNAYTSGRLKILGKITPEASVFGEYEQALSDGSRRRIALGGEYRFTEKTRLYARHEIENSLTGIYGLTNDGTRNIGTIIGVDTAINVPYFPDGQIYGEYRAAGGVGNTDVAAVAGIRNVWKPAPGFGLSTSLERQQIYHADGVKHDATAISLAAEYTADPVNKIAGRLEYRTSDIQNQWLSTAAYTRILSDNWSAIARDVYARSEGIGVSAAQGVQLQNQFQMGLAYRDTETGRWNGLLRAENRVNRSSLTSSLTDEDTWIVSAHGTYHPARAWTFAGQLAAKHGAQVISNDGSTNTYSGRLASGRVIWDLTERIDASLYGSYGRDGGGKLSGLGLEVGARIINNLWLSAGYTKGRFADVDQFSANSSWSGWHARLRYKFDENSLGIATKRDEAVKPVAAIEAAMAKQAIPVIAPVITQVVTPVPVTVIAPKYEKITLAADVLFGHNKSGIDQILPEGRAKLNALAAKLKAVNNVERVTISGHADITNSTSNAKYNDNLSLERAISVKTYLSSQGFDVTSVSVAGFGGQQPVKTDCALPKGASRTAIGVTQSRASLKEMENFRACLLPNRRVEVEIYGQTLVK
jgi:outer membrane protein OmpA-like peptidoglycan-associated protein